MLNDEKLANASLKERIEKMERFDIQRNAIMNISKNRITNAIIILLTMSICNRKLI